MTDQGEETVPVGDLREGERKLLVRSVARFEDQEAIEKLESCEIISTADELEKISNGESTEK